MDNYDPYNQNAAPGGYDFVDPYARMYEDTNTNNGFQYDENEEFYVLPEEVPETGYTPEEILRAIVTPYGNKRPRAITGAVSSLMRSNLKEPQKEGEHMFKDALVTVERRHDIVFVGFEFPDQFSDDLKKLWRLLRDYGKTLERYALVPNVSPEFDIFVMPNTNINVSMNCTAPFFWTLQAMEPGGKPVQICLLFKEDDINFTVNSMTEELVEDFAVAELDRKREKIEEENKLLEEQLDKMDERNHYAMADDFENIVPGESMLNQPQSHTRKYSS